MGDGTEGKPYTREDVIKAIEENGGSAKGLDLSRKVFEEGIDLYELNLEGIVLADAHLEKARLSNAHLERADLRFTHLEGAHLFDAHLERADLGFTHLEGSILSGAHLEEAILWDTHLKGANLYGIHLEGANLINTKFSSDVNLEDVDWGNYILGEERKRQFGIAADTYRRLKQWYTIAGMYDIAGKFFYREMEAKRKSTQQRIYESSRRRTLGNFLYVVFKRKDFGNWVRLWLYGLTCGYGERPWQVFASAGVTMLGLALIYFATGALTPNSLLDSLYFSAVSFTALGYGSWAPLPTGWVKGLGVAESFIGVFMMALFLVTFTRKMTR